MRSISHSLVYSIQLFFIVCAFKHDVHHFPGTIILQVDHKVLQPIKWTEFIIQVLSTIQWILVIIRSVFDKKINNS